MLYTIRSTVIPGGEKMVDATRKTILATLYCILNSTSMALFQPDSHFRINIISFRN